MGKADYTESQGETTVAKEQRQAEEAKDRRHKWTLWRLASVARAEPEMVCVSLGVHSRRTLSTDMIYIERSFCVRRKRRPTGKKTRRGFFIRM